MKNKVFYRSSTISKRLIVYIFFSIRESVSPLWESETVLFLSIL